jgi:hypothetical protein
MTVPNGTVILFFFANLLLTNDNSRGIFALQEVLNMSARTSAKFTLWINRIIALTVIGLLPAMPALLRWYETLRPLGQHSAKAIAFGFYLCAPVVLYALWCIDRLVTNILAEQVFITENVRRLRRIRWCCAGVSGICVPAAVFYQPLIFMVVIMAFLALVVSVVKNVMAAAVQIREENDLTI